MEPEILEILIGKFIDGEITTKEQEILDEEIEHSFETRELLKELRELDKRSKEAISSDIMAHGREADDIFECAWQRRSHPVFRFLTPSSGWFRFAVGLAAGLLIGIVLNFTLSSKAVPPTDMQQQVAVQGSQVPGDIQASAVTTLPNPSTKTVNRNVDWFSFTDEDGDEWIVEGLRKDVVRPASYSKEL
ncbi:MAG: hypothetical protein ACYSSP_06490 [Planctomycetota bacterium]|jgi:anti-sigma factor RsiW